MVSAKLTTMPRGSKSSYSAKQKRQAEHIEESYESRGTRPGEAKKRAWATVNKMTGGGKRSGSGRGDGGTPPLKGEALKQMQNRLGGGWQVLNEQKLEKQFKFPDFRKALEFVNRVGEVAEKQNHHPDIYFTWGEARLQIWTHKIQGLTESDFVLAAKIDELH
jgi:4a-hydroxytetrahydrobiopterin dehydratase